MLTNLSWLAPGKVFPPESELPRIEMYIANERLFESRHAEVWRSAFEALSQRLRKRGAAIDTVLNYQQLLSKKTADFVCGEPPTIESEQDTDALMKILEKQRWATKLYEAVIDISRFGNAVPKIVDRRLTAVSPKHWFPIVDPTDLKNIVQHVIAYPTAHDADGIPTRLYVEIHNIGKITTQQFMYASDTKTIGDPVDEAVDAITGLDSFAVFPMTNVTHSSSVFGIDDYSAVNSVVAKILWRLHRADVILDKHSEPSVSGPASALELDPKTGMYFLNLGNYFKRNSDQDPDLKYITWDGNLESNFKEIEVLLDQLYTLSEMGQAFSEAAGGTADSGEALKLRMVSPRIKASRIVNLNAGTVKQIVATIAQVNNVPLDYDSLTIRWNDGLPVDAKEQTEILVAATGGKAIMSQYAALKARGLTDTETEDELEQMQIEQSASMPVTLSVADPFNDDDDEDDVTE